MEEQYLNWTWRRNKVRMIACPGLGALATIFNSLSVLMLNLLGKHTYIIFYMYSLPVQIMFKIWKSSSGILSQVYQSRQITWANQLVITHILLIQQLQYSKWEKRTMIYPSSQPEGPCICHNMLSGNVRLQHRTAGFVNRTTWRELTALLHSDWLLWPPRCFFRGPKRWKSHGTKTPHSPTDGSLVAAIWMGVSWTFTIKPQLCTKWVSSFSVSEDASWWFDSKMSRKFRKLSHIGSNGKDQSSVLMSCIHR